MNHEDSGANNVLFDLIKIFFLEFLVQFLFHHSLLFKIVRKENFSGFAFRNLYDAHFCIQRELHCVCK
jgi:hypothetical protein